MLSLFYISVFVTLLQGTSATNGEPFEISSGQTGFDQLHDELHDEVPQQEINHIDTTDEFSTSDSENISTLETTRQPEGKMFQYDGYGYRGEHYGRGGGYGPRQGYGYGPRRHHQDHGHKKEEDIHVSVPYIDRNGCTKPGDIVCDLTPGTKANPTGCSYNLCILADENKNLWKKPTLTVSQVKCPEDRGVTAVFCNQNTLLLRAAALLQTKKGPDRHQHYHTPTFVKVVDPCIVFNDACRGP